MNKLFILAIQELEGGTYTIDTILDVINQLTIWSITIGIALSGLAAVIYFIELAVMDAERKERAKRSLVSLVVGITGIVLAISLVNILLRIFI